MAWCGKGVWELELGEVGLGIPEMGMGVGANWEGVGEFCTGEVSEISWCRQHRAHLSQTARKSGVAAPGSRRL